MDLRAAATPGLPYGDQTMAKRVADMTPEQIEARRARERRRYANDPEYRERHRKRQRERYANDPEFRQRHCERQRVANMTPERLERHRERNRARDAQRIQIDGVRYRNPEDATVAALRLLGASDGRLQ
jgi:hypothetical protein